MTEDEIHQCLQAVEKILREEPCTVSIRRGMKQKPSTDGCEAFEPTNEFTIRIDANGGVKEDDDGRSQS